MKKGTAYKQKKDDTFHRKPYDSYMSSDNKVDLTKMTKSQSTGKSISEKLQHSIALQVNGAMSPVGQSKSQLLEMHQASLYKNDSWQVQWSGFDSYIIFESSSQNYILFAYSMPLIFALANFHFGGDFKSESVARNYPTPMEKKLMRELSERQMNSLIQNFKHIEPWQILLQSQHVEMIHKKIIPRKFYEARFELNSNIPLDQNNQHLSKQKGEPIDFMVSVLFTKQNPMS